MIDRDIHTARALLIEGNALLRSVTVAQLRDGGLGSVASANGVRDARVMLEQQAFDIVVCSREFEGSNESGQDLLDELRREHLLPQSTVFLMITAQAAYHQVVEAAEGALDGLLVRPFTAATLYQRLQEARHRKRELSEVLNALDAGQTEIAFARALKRFQDRLPFGNYCGRLAAELLITMGRPGDSRRVFEKLYDINQAPWAKLGVARTELLSGNLPAANRALQDVLAQDPESADAHDLLGRMLVEQCNFDGALEHYRAAAKLTPGCLLRVQHAGVLAFYQGQGLEARRWLERTVSMGMQSKLFDALSLLLIAMLCLDDKDMAAVASTVASLRKYQGRQPDSPRLRRLAAAAGIVAQLSTGQTACAVEALAQFSGTAGDDDFDLETATLLLMLWARTPPDAVQSAQHIALVKKVGMRFCVAKATGEVLLAAARRTEPAQGLIRQCQAAVLALSEAAMTRSMAGDAAGAVQQLLTEGERTLNGKLLELAGLIARRHQAALGDAEALAARAAAGVRRSCSANNQMAGIQRSGRAPGSLLLRGKAQDEAVHTTP